MNFAIFLESGAKWLLGLHLVAAACVGGSAVHLAIRVWGYLRGRFVKVGHEKLYAHILAVSYAVCFGLGAAVYPTFRVRVRAEYFEPHLAWATGLFEAKEHLATIGAAAVVGVWVLSRAMARPGAEEDRRLLPLYAGLLAVVLLVTAFNIWSGWYLTTLKAV